MALARNLIAQEDLVALTTTIHIYRFLTLQQLRRLHPDLNPADLNLAVRTRHIAAIRRPTMRARIPEVVYALDRAGADLLTDVLAIDRAQLKWRAHRNLIGLLFLDHRLAVNDVRIANDGLDAVEQAERFQPDIVLMDIGMPRLDGYEAARRIRNQGWSRDTLLVAVTGWGPSDDSEEATAAGFDHHFTKPLDPAELRRLVNGVRPH